MVDKAIEVKNLSYSYPDGTEALCDISLDVSPGESVGIIGPNGAGKSTLLLHLNGLLKGKGQIRIFGLEVNNSNLPQIRHNVGMVFQDPDSQLFMPTVFDDVSFGPINLGFPQDKVKAFVEEALRKVDMLSFVNRSSHHLSLGEKKRVSIATVLSMSPRIMVLDEPSSNLDPKHRRELIDLLNQLELTKVIASHDLDLVLRTCSRVAVIHRGRIVMTGRALDVLRDKFLLETHDLEVPYSVF